jgi:hypothetical protein
MTRLRFTLAQLMAAVIFIGLGFAALRSASRLGASVVFTLTVGVLSAAILRAMARPGRTRMTWAGFALFGWIYLGTTFGPWAAGNGMTAPPYVTRWVLDYTAERLRVPDLRDTGVAGEVLFSPSPTGGIGAMMSGGGMSGGAPPLVPRRDLRAFHRIGHCLAAIMFGLVGAILGRFIATEDERPHH